MWKAILAVAVLSTLAFGEVPAGGTHGGITPVVNQSQQVAQPAPDNTANLMVKLNACMQQRPVAKDLKEALSQAGR